MPRIALLLACVLLLSGCGERAALATTPEHLANVQEDFDGRNVVVSGTLRSIAAPRHYWIEDTALHRVAIEGAADDVLQELVGARVRVRGRFRYDRSAGRRIDMAGMEAERAEAP
jgi:hypothetical protein